jgi:hypothetical protein
MALSFCILTGIQHKETRIDLQSQSKNRLDRAAGGRDHPHSSGLFTEDAQMPRCGCLVVLCLTAVVGACRAAPRQAGMAMPEASPAVAPAGRELRAAEPAESSQQVLQRRREAVAAELLQMIRQMEAFALEHPNLAELHDLHRINLTQIGQAETAARIALADARARFGSDHPAVKAAERNAQQLRSMQQSELEELARLNTLLAEQKRLNSELPLKRDFLRRLDERIEMLEP